MMRLIDADALKETIHEHDYLLKDFFNSTSRGMFTNGIDYAIDEQPTIDSADALEAAEKQIAEQQKQIANLYILLNNRINEIAELEAQIKMDGEEQEDETRENME